MDPLTISLISFGCILASAVTGFVLARFLPEHHLNSESRDAVKMGWGIVATMSALVLGLLVASAKNTYDTANTESTETAAKLVVLNHKLVQFGPDADGVRSSLRSAIASAIKRDYPDVNLEADVPAAAENANVMEGFSDRLITLTPKTDAQQVILAQAKQLTIELNLARWLLIEQSKNPLPLTLIVAVVFWLSILFLGLGLFCPNNHTVLIMLILCSVSVSVAIFLVNDMSHPFKGLITVSPGAMLDVWGHLNHP